MNFFSSSMFTADRLRFREFIKNHIIPHLSGWYRSGSVPRTFFEAMGQGSWYGFEMKNGSMQIRSPFWDEMVMSELAVVSPGVAVTALVQSDLGMMGLNLFGSGFQKQTYADAAVKGEQLICLGNTEKDAGSDVANISMQAEKTGGGWLLNGSKAYVTNGAISDLAVVTAVTEPDAPRNRRLSMFLVDLDSAGVTRKKLKKQVWIPSDLTRIQFDRVFVPDDHLMGLPGKGLAQVLSIFGHSRVPISALTLGTAYGAFQLALGHAKSRRLFDGTVIDFQAKEFEIAELYAHMEAARLMVHKACAVMEKGGDFRMDASLAKFLSVKIARDVTVWSADLFGAASVMVDHPVHKFPMDAWASSLGEGTQDVQKLVIFRELMKQERVASDLK